MLFLNYERASLEASSLRSTVPPNQVVFEVDHGSSFIQYRLSLMASYYLCYFISMMHSISLSIRPFVLFPELAFEFSRMSFSSPLTCRIQLLRPHQFCPLTLGHKCVASDKLTARSYVGFLFGWTPSMSSCRTHLMAFLIHGYGKVNEQAAQMTLTPPFSKVYVDLFLYFRNPPSLENFSSSTFCLHTNSQLCNLACQHSLSPNSLISFLHLQIHTSHFLYLALLNRFGSKFYLAGRGRDILAG